MGRQDEIGLDSAALADALYRAATTGDYHCPLGGLYGRPVDEVLWPDQP